MTLTYHMLKGSHNGHSTTDVEQYIRWLSELTVVTPEHAQKLRNVVAEAVAEAHDNAKAARNVDRVIDKAAAKFEDRPLSE